MLCQRPFSYYKIRTDIPRGLKLYITSMGKILYWITWYSFLLIKQGIYSKMVKDLAKLLAASVSVFEDLKVEKLEEVLSFLKSEVVGWS